MAKFAHGTTIAMGTTFAVINYVGDIHYKPPVADRIVVKNQSSTTGHKEHILGLIDGGVVSFSLGYDPAVTVHENLRAAHNARETFKLWPKGATAGLTFQADVVFELDSPEDKPHDAKVQLLIEGPVT